MAFNYDLTRIGNREQLLTFLGIDSVSFNKVLEFDPEEYAREIRSGASGVLLSSPFIQHKIPKRNQKDIFDRTRTVWEAVSIFDRQYKATARKLDAFLSFKTAGFPHNNAYGYIRGRNIRQNAYRHVGQRHILKCDIKDFFGSIHLGSGLIDHIQKMTMAAMAMADMKVWAQRS